MAVSVPVSPLDAVFGDWALARLKACALPEARLIDEIYGVEPGCIYFTTRAPIGRRLRAHTGLLKDTEGGPVVYRIVPGWPCRDAGVILQGTVPTPRTWEGDGA